MFSTALGTHLNPTRDVLDVLKSFLRQAGLPHIRFHDLRHSSAAMLLGMKVHPKIVQEILGHSQITIILDIYSHVLPILQEEAMNRLNEALQGEGAAPFLSTFLSRRHNKGGSGTVKRGFKPTEETGRVSAGTESLHRHDPSSHIHNITTLPIKLI